MNFDDTPQEAEFRATARKWIEANAPKQYEAELSKSSLGRIRLEKEEIVDVGKAWQRKKAEGGWACLHWPKEYGGRGATPIEKVIWQQEEGVYGKLTQPFQIGEGMCGPTVMAFGSEEHKRHYLPKLASGEHIWCQLFSEQANGMQEFNEVYFTDVVIPDHQRLGAVGDGWNVSLTTLMNERMSIGSRLATGFPEMFEFCSNLMTDDGLAIDDPATRSKLASW